jgi:hypothetical protein
MPLASRKPAWEWHFCIIRPRQTGIACLYLDSV